MQENQRLSSVESFIDKEDYKPQLRIIFLGTPEFAVASLDALHKTGYNIVGVVTAPGKPAGRGMKLTESAVKKYAIEKGLHILQPEKLKSPEFIAALKSLNADLQVVVAFRMLPEVVWNMPRMGTINVHASLLPKYRGAAPINWAIINGEKETGVTTFKLKHEIDTGNILLQEKISIAENETAGELHDRLKELGAKALVKTVKGLEEGSLAEIAQDVVMNDESLNVRGETLDLPDRQAGVKQESIPHSPLPHAPKIFTDTCKIDWNKTADEIFNLIRGLSPYPGAFTYLENKMFKIYKAEKELTTPVVVAGLYATDKKTFLKFACRNGYISVKEIQLEGKKKMLVEDFLRGYHFA